MDYLEFYRLKTIPFANAPDLRFYYDGYQYGYTEERLIHIVNQMGGLAVVIGGMGMGKSIAARHLLDRLNAHGTEYECGLMIIVHTAITASWLLKKIAIQIGVNDPADEKVNLISQLFGRLIEIQEEGRKAVILIDEANMLQAKEIMEEFRGLLNLEVPGKKLVTFIFFGMPELDEYLKLDEPLRQRIALRMAFKPFSEEATKEYILHRLKIADLEEGFSIFSEESMKLIHIYSKGIPRLINTICDNALLEGYLKKINKVDPDIIEQICGELMLNEPSPSEIHEGAKPASAKIYPIG
jgi:general secretion pathway protein A